MMNLARKMKKHHCFLWRRRTGESICVSLVFHQERLSQWVFFVRFGIPSMFMEKHWPKCLTLPTENQQINPSIECPFNVPFSRNVIAILCVSQHWRKTFKPPSMNSPCYWSTTWSVFLHQGLQLCLLILSPLELNEVCILLRYAH